MSQQLRQLKTRIRSVEGTWKVTRAMEMVSMAKFKGFEGPLKMGRLYDERVHSLFENLVAAEGSGANHFLTAKEEKGPVGICVLTSDAGLCGGFNDMVLDKAIATIKELGERPYKVFMYGRKGLSEFKNKGIAVEKFFPVVHGRAVGNFQAPLLNTLIEAYEKGTVSEVHVFFTRFKNAMHYRPEVQQFLPIQRTATEHKSFIIESGYEGILPEVIPMYLSSMLRLMMLESSTSEHAARMVSMKSAKENAKELMGELILLRNKIRQASITKEVIEIISSVEALKG